MWNACLLERPYTRLQSHPFTISFALLSWKCPVVPSLHVFLLLSCACHSLSLANSPCRAICQAASFPFSAAVLAFLWRHVDALAHFIRLLFCEFLLLTGLLVTVWKIYQKCPTAPTRINDDFLSSSFTFFSFSEHAQADDSWSGDSK